MLLLALISALLGMIAIGALLWMWWGPRFSARARLAAVRAPGAGRARPDPSAQAQWSGSQDRTATFSRLLRRLPWYDTLQLEVLRAGWLLRPAEFLSLTALAGLTAAGVIMVITHSTGMGAVALAGGLLVPYLLMKSKQAARSKALSAQIPDALDMLCSSMRAGFSISRGLELIKTQMHPPISVEFGRVLEETQFGISLSEALDGIVFRTGNYDVELVIAAIQTQLEMGGNLAEVLSNISHMIRERVKLSGEIATATAEGRFSAGILLAMPIAIAFIINIINPGYISPLFNSQLGLMLLGAGALLMTVGALIIKKLITIDL